MLLAVSLQLKVLKPLFECSSAGGVQRCECFASILNQNRLSVLTVVRHPMSLA